MNHKDSNPTVHHRKCKSLGGTSERRNISIVPDVKHTAWHIVFENRTPEMIAKYINAVWLDPDYEFICVPRKKKQTDPNQTVLPLGFS
jgi:hypothetical protein